MQVYNLGDTAITIELGNIISEELNNKVLSMQQWLKQHSFEGMQELVAAYSSLTVYYDPYIIKKKYQPVIPVYRWMEEKLQEAFKLSASQYLSPGTLHHIPVCYDEDFGIDISNLASLKQISKEKIIELHISKIYRVYMIGFLPGFPYLAEVDEQLATPRKQKPVNVEAGSVGIAGSQTGIYPFNSPGGWHIIGRTPISLFNSENEPPVWLKPGDRVQFYSIERDGF